MGTASLVIGLGLIIIGFFLAVYFLTSPTTEEFQYVLLGTLIISAPPIAIGGLLLRKYDSDKKKEKEGNVKQPPRSLRKSPILKGTIIGIIAVSIIGGLFFSYTYQAFVMTNDAMAPTINEFDRISYEQTPIDEILLDDIVVYTDLSGQNKILVHKVIGITYTDPLTLRVKSEASPTIHLVTEEHYVGKITSIEAGSGKINQIYTPQINIVILIVAFVTPIVLMKMRDLKKKEKNS